MSIEISQGERLFAVGILLQWFWSSVALTGNETQARKRGNMIGFWSSVALTGNETPEVAQLIKLLFWSSVALTGNETIVISKYIVSCFGAVSP